MRRFHPWLAALLMILTGAASAQAHFLFVRILPAAEGGRFSEVYFSDQADAGDPRFIDKIASTQLWLQTEPGKFTPLKVHQAADRLRALVPSSGGFAVVGKCTYGVLARAKQPAFLLRHYPKAVAGDSAAIATLQPKGEIPFEIQIRPDSAGLEFTALRKGKPLPNAVFHWVAVDLKGASFKADEQGKARWTPPAPGAFAVYTGQTLAEAGAHQGAKYDEIREFTTLAFTWPLDAKGADPEAAALFQEAMAARAAWKGFPGFSADIAARVDGRPWKGTVTISAKGTVELTMEDEAVTPWIQEQLDSLVMHRIARPQGTQEKAAPVRFADADRDHPLGRLLLFEGGKFASSYRVKDKQLLVVNRHLGKVNMTITVLDNDKNKEGQFLPRSYTVQYWDAATGQLQRTETIQDRWTRVGAWDLPTLHQVVTSSSAGQSMKMMNLSWHELLKATK